jgi:hypothetical protein
MAQAFESGFEAGNVLSFTGGTSEEYRDYAESVETHEDDTSELARVLPLSAAMVRHAVHEEAMDTLAEVVDLDIARRAVNEAFGFTPATELPTLLPTGTEHVTPVQPQASRPQLVNESFVAQHETAAKHEFKSRGATEADIERLVDVDMHAFESVYRNYGMSKEELRADLIEKFRGRLEMVGGDWMRVVEKDGIIAGFMTCCPTSKSPEDFESWEKTTDNGTLKTTYDPDGKNVYVVSLSMLPGVGEGARNMLFADQIGKIIEGGHERAFFESRLPGLGAWARRECREQGTEFDALSKAEQKELAERYFATTKTVKGKEVPIDRLIRIYTGAGCKFTRVVADAYDDAPSMNFGAVGVFENPLPKAVRNNRLVGKIVGKSVQMLAKSHWLMQKVF